MKNKPFYLLFLFPFLLLFVGCAGSTPADPIALATEVPTLVPTATSEPTVLTQFPTQVPPAPTAEPSLTPDPTHTPTPLPTATTKPAGTETDIPQTETPQSKSLAKEGAFLEWIPPQETSSLVSISGGSIEGYELMGEFAAVIMGESIAVLDMSVSPIAEEVSRMMLRGEPSSHARSGRFWFLKIWDFVSIIDLSDPLNVNEVARVNNLGAGRVTLGEDGQVYFIDEGDKTWWALDVDQVLPAMRVTETPIQAKPEVNQQSFTDKIWKPHFLQLREQLESMTTDYPNWLPEAVKKIGDDYIYINRTGDVGGGYLIRLNVETAEIPRVTSTFRSFYPKNIEVENQTVYTAFSYEQAGGAAVIDVQEPTQPRFRQVFNNSSNSVYAINNMLLTGGRPGLIVFDLDNQVDRGAEIPMFNERAPIPFTIQLEANDDETVLFGLTGIYTERGGIAVYSIENPDSPTPISFIDFSAPYGPTEIKSAADRLYAYHINQFGESVITVFDVSDPTNPEEMMSWVTEEQVIGLEAWQDGTGRHLIAALTPDEISIWDVTNPAGTYQQLGRLFAPPQCVIDGSNTRLFAGYHRKTLLVDNWLFASLGRCRTNRIDISDPATPIILETLDSNGPMVFEDGLLFMGGRNLRIYKFE